MHLRLCDLLDNLYSYSADYIARLGMASGAIVGRAFGILPTDVDSIDRQCGVNAACVHISGRVRPSTALSDWLRFSDLANDCTDR